MNYVNDGAVCLLLLLVSGGPLSVAVAAEELATDMADVTAIHVDSQACTSSREREALVNSLQRALKIVDIGLAETREQANAVLNLQVTELHADNLVDRYDPGVPLTTVYKARLIGRDGQQLAHETGSERERASYETCREIGRRVGLGLRASHKASTRRRNSIPRY